ncbi:MAG: hypothetical protein NTX86_01980 [Candidatus Dependentiae bacterium]|nr:hypothetical protein [Candidatus Dependentiae bacterium]
MKNIFSKALLIALSLVLASQLSAAPSDDGYSQGREGERIGDAISFGALGAFGTLAVLGKIAHKQNQVQDGLTGIAAVLGAKAFLNFVRFVARDIEFIREYMPFFVNDDKTSFCKKWYARSGLCASSFSRGAFIVGCFMAPSFIAN